MLRLQLSERLVEGEATSYHGSMKTSLLFAVMLVGSHALIFAQAAPSFALPTDQLLSEAGPVFNLADRELASPVKIITYGDQRFTDPSNTRQTSPLMRQWLVRRIASEKPAALIMNGDVPLAGDVPNDYAVFRAETLSWRDAHLRVFPTLGNHEWRADDPRQALDNWWNAFPELRNRRWYSAQIGSRIYVIALDSGASLLPESDQAQWLASQIDNLPGSIDFVILALHHPPVADVQTRIEVDHNPRPNEIALRDYLSKIAPTTHAQFLVSAGHIHNYERSIVDGVTYLVSGGGGAPPYFVERTKDDLYKSILFPNYHYVRLTLEKDRLHCEMVRVVNPEAESLSVEVKDRFDLLVKSR